MNNTNKKADVTSRQNFSKLSKQERERRLKQLEDFLKLTKEGVSREEALKTIGIKDARPEIRWESGDYRQAHDRGFSFLTLNNSRLAKDVGGDFTKFSVFVGNGLEGLSNPTNDNIAIFDPTDDDQQTIAAQFHVTSLTTIPIKNLIATPGNNDVSLGSVLSNRSAIRARADAIELKGNEMVIIKSGDRTKNSMGIRPGSIGGVHIYSGDSESKFASKSQPMVLGNNLQKAMSEIYDTLQSLSSNITNINIEIMTMKANLSVHFHPPLAPPSPTIAPIFIPTMLTKDLLRILNSFSTKINHKIEKFNRVFKFTSANILSKHNTVN